MFFHYLDTSEEFGCGLIVSALFNEFPTHGEVEDGLAQLFDVFRASGEAWQMVEIEPGVVAEGFWRIIFRRFSGGVQAVQAGRHQPVAALLSFVFRRLQLVAQRHQFVHLGDDAVLLGEGWDGKRQQIGI